MYLSKTLLYTYIACRSLTRSPNICRRGQTLLNAKLIKLLIAWRSTNFNSKYDIVRNNKRYHIDMTISSKNTIQDYDP